jgi:hypothetical protein
LYEAHTVVRVSAYVTASTSCSFNIEERSDIGTAGPNILGSELVAGTGGATDSSPTNASLAADAWLWVDISDVTGTPGRLVISLACTV